MGSTHGNVSIVNRLHTLLDHQLPSPLERLPVAWQGSNELTLLIKRDDLIHPQISGNKWRKLKGWLEQAQDYKGLMSCGGAYSNHLLALAALKRMSDFPLKVFIRGDELNASSNQLLHYVHESGVEMKFVSRAKYREFRKQPPQEEGWLWIPEGGKGEAAFSGLSELGAELPENLDYLFVACGTGTSLSGLLKFMKNAGRRTEVVGVACLPSKSWMANDVAQMSGVEQTAISIEHRFSGAHFADSSSELEAFCRSFSAATSISIEPVYTGKLFMAVRQWVEEKKFEAGSRVAILHCGGVHRFD